MREIRYGIIYLIMEARILASFYVAFKLDFGSLTNRNFTHMLQVTFGYFFPMAMMITEEMVSRKVFSRRHGLEFPPMHHPKNLIIRHLMLVPFQGATAFLFIVFLLRLGGW